MGSPEIADGRIKTLSRQNGRASNQKCSSVKTPENQNALASSRKRSRVESKMGARQNGRSSKRQEVKTVRRQAGRRGADPGAPGPDQHRDEDDRVAERQPPMGVRVIGVIEQLGAEREHRTADQQVGEPGHRVAIRAGARSGKKATLWHRGHCHRCDDL